MGSLNGHAVITDAGRYTSSTQKKREREKNLGDIHSGSTGPIVLHKESKKMLTKNGVRQGDTISPVLFTACLHEVFRALE